MGGKTFRGAGGGRRTGGRAKEQMGRCKSCVAAAAAAAASAKGRRRLRVRYLIRRRWMRSKKELRTSEGAKERGGRDAPCNLQVEDSESRLWGGVIIAVTAQSSSEKSLLLSASFSQNCEVACHWMARLAIKIVLPNKTGVARRRLNPPIYSPRGPLIFLPPSLPRQAGGITLYIRQQAVSLSLGPFSPRKSSLAG